MTTQFRFNWPFNRRPHGTRGVQALGLMLAGVLFSRPVFADVPVPTGHAEKGWQATVAAELARLRADTPELYAKLMVLAPIRTRDHSFKFTSPLLVQPGAAAVVIARLTDPSTPAVWRPALAQALEQTGDPNLGAAIAGLLPGEADETVRVRLVFALRRTSGASSQEALWLGLNDVSAKVRAWAAKARGYQGRPLGATSKVDLKLLDVLHETDPDSAAQAAWACARLQLRAAIPHLQQHLSHADARVRLAALHALVDLDPAALEANSLQRLLSDADARVAALARRTLAR